VLSVGFDNSDKVIFEDDMYLKKGKIIKSLRFKEFEIFEDFLDSTTNGKGFCSLKKLEQKFIHKNLENAC